MLVDEIKLFLFKISVRWPFVTSDLYPRKTYGLLGTESGEKPKGE